MLLAINQLAGFVELDQRRPRPLITDFEMVGDLLSGPKPAFGLEQFSHLLPEVLAVLQGLGLPCDAHQLPAVVLLGALEVEHGANVLDSAAGPQELQAELIGAGGGVL